jgi:hypothetical protein
VRCAGLHQTVDTARAPSRSSSPSVLQSQVLPPLPCHRRLASPHSAAPSYLASQEGGGRAQERGALAAPRQAMGGAKRADKPPVGADDCCHHFGNGNNMVRFLSISVISGAFPFAVAFRYNRVASFDCKDVRRHSAVPVHFLWVTLRPLLLY